jgi:MoaA/NifB/PqqE/SkfB family radical SAM enzyme
MFNFTELKQIHLEISNNCQAACPMCNRNIRGGLDNPLIKLNDWTLLQFQTILTHEVLNQIEGFFFCGNFGDPIMNNDLIAMCKYSTEINPGLNIRIHTNGSARSLTWWRELAESLPKTHSLVFAIDGLEDTHHIYRIGTNYNQILKNAQAFIAAGGIAEWAFIKFKHNEHQVEEARQLATSLGFKTFTTKNSSRFVGEPSFDVVDKDRKILYQIEPPSDTKIKFIDKNVLKNYKNILAEVNIDCYAKHNKEIYIDAFMNVLPCCFLASVPYTYIEPNDIAGVIRQEIISQYNDLIQSLGGLDKLNALEHGIKTILSMSQWNSVWETYWNEKKLITCGRSCGVTDKFSIPTDQFIGQENLDE